MTNEMSLFEQLGGRKTLEKVHRIFYDEAYSHPWLKNFFGDIDQDHIEAQQTDFMTGAMGGPKCYFGKTVVSAHKHIYVTQELFEVRHKMLTDSLVKGGVPEGLREKWLAIDAAFNKGVVKDSMDKCVQRYHDEPIQAFAKPPCSPVGNA